MLLLSRDPFIDCGFEGFTLSDMIVLCFLIIHLMRVLQMNSCMSTSGNVLSSSLSFKAAPGFSKWQNRCSVISYVRSLSRLSKSVWLALVGWLKNCLRWCVASFMLQLLLVLRCGPTVWTLWAWGDGRNVVACHTWIALKWLCSAFEASVNLALWSCSADRSLNCKGKGLCLKWTEKTG